MSLQVHQISLEKEYEKHKNINREDIKQLRDWLKTQPHLPEEHITELDLILNYHCCGASDMYTKEVLDLHYTLRTLFTAFFKDRVVDNTVAETMKTIMFSPLREHDIHGVRYIYCGIRRPEPKYFNLVDTGRAFMMIVDLWQYEEGTWPGFSLVIDLKKATWGHVTRLDLGALRQIIHFVQDGILLKMKNIIFINALNFIDKLMMILKPLMKKELYSKFIIYDESADLSTTDVPVRAFPKDFGGNDLSGQEITDQILERMKSNTQFFKNENLKRVNESLRPFKSPVVEDAIGIGSFKKLDLD